MIHEIKLPSFYTDGKSTKIIMQQLNECFLDYKYEFNLEPDVIIFCGENGKNLFNLIGYIFKGVYYVECKNNGFDGIIFKSGKIKKQRQEYEVGTSRGDSLSGKVVPGFCAPNIADFMPFTYTKEVDVETIKEYSIKIV